MNYNKSKLASFLLMILLAGSMLSSCSKDEWFDDMEFPGEEPPGQFPGDTDGSVPAFDPEIYPWNGEKADDASSDKVDPANADIYHEANTFTEKQHFGKFLKFQFHM